MRNEWENKHIWERSKENHMFINLGDDGEKSFKWRKKKKNKKGNIWNEYS